MRIKTKTFLTMALIAILSLSTSAVYAQYTSPSYRVDETIFGAGGELENSSANYRARSTVGELGVGNTASANYQAYGGFNTTGDPMLEVYVAGGTFDLGYLEIGTPKAAVAEFTVRSYVSSGYIITLGGTPPKNKDGGHTLTGINPAAAINPNEDQFGVNLVANNVAPIGPFGADPGQLPDTTFGFGQPTADYGTANLFKYEEYDVIAESLRSSGVTAYSLSLVASAGKNATAGFYSTDIFVIVTPTF